MFRVCLKWSFFGAASDNRESSSRLRNKCMHLLLKVCVVSTRIQYGLKNRLKLKKWQKYQNRLNTFVMFVSRWIIAAVKLLSFRFFRFSCSESTSPGFDVPKSLSWMLSICSFGEMLLTASKSSKFWPHQRTLPRWSGKPFEFEEFYRVGFFEHSSVNLPVDFEFKGRFLPILSSYLLWL